jgi:hypothetical protein
MVAVLISDDADGKVAAVSLQRFLTAVAFQYDLAVDDGGGDLGGDGENDAYHPFASRDPRAFVAIFKAEAPLGIRVEADERLAVALAYYREGLNATSPFYRCVAFRNVLDAVFEVEQETVRGTHTATAEAATRDSFVDANASRIAGWFNDPTPAGGWAEYLREEVRNALAHVNRAGTRTEVNPDNPTDRVRLKRDARVMQRIARAAIEVTWPDAVVVAQRDRT